MNFDDKHIYLIFTAQHLLKNHLVKALKDADVKITPAHTTILFLLENKSPRTMTELGLALHIDNSTVTGLIDRLEKSGFVCRDDHPADRRKWGVSITKDGLAEITKAKLVIKKVNKQIETGFSRDDIITLHRVLGTFNDKFS